MVLFRITGEPGNLSVEEPSSIDSTVNTGSSNNDSAKKSSLDLSEASEASGDSVRETCETERDDGFLIGWSTDPTKYSCSTSVTSNRPTQDDAPRQRPGYTWDPKDCGRWTPADGEETRPGFCLTAAENAAILQRNSELRRAINARKAVGTRDHGPGDLIKHGIEDYILFGKPDEKGIVTVPHDPCTPVLHSPGEYEALENFLLAVNEKVINDGKKMLKAADKRSHGYDQDYGVFFKAIEDVYDLHHRGLPEAEDEDFVCQATQRLRNFYASMAALSNRDDPYTIMCTRDPRNDKNDNHWRHFHGFEDKKHFNIELCMQDVFSDENIHKYSCNKSWDDMLNFLRPILPGYSHEKYGGRPDYGGPDYAEIFNCEIRKLDVEEQAQGDSQDYSNFLKAVDKLFINRFEHYGSLAEIQLQTKMNSDEEETLKGLGLDPDDDTPWQVVCEEFKETVRYHPYCRGTRHYQIEALFHKDIAETTELMCKDGESFEDTNHKGINGMHHCVRSILTNGFVRFEGDTEIPLINYNELRINLPISALSSEGNGPKFHRPFQFYPVHDSHVCQSSWEAIIKVYQEQGWLEPQGKSTGWDEKLIQLAQDVCFY